MTTQLFPNAVIIHFPASEPEQTRKDLLHALSAAVRWRAAYKEDYKNDDYNLAMIAELLQCLAAAEE
jgi:hypothetical protein